MALGTVLNVACGGLLSGAAEAGGFAVDTVMKVADFVGLKNIVSLGVTAAGAMGGNEALTFAGIGSLIGGKSAIRTMVGAGVGFVAGSMLQAEELATEATREIEDCTPKISETVPEIAPEYTNRFENVGPLSIEEIMPTEDLLVDNLVYGS